MQIMVSKQLYILKCHYQCEMFYMEVITNYDFGHLFKFIPNISLCTKSSMISWTDEYFSLACNNDKWSFILEWVINYYCIDK